MSALAKAIYNCVVQKHRPKPHRSFVAAIIGVVVAVTLTQCSTDGQNDQAESDRLQSLLAPAVSKKAINLLLSDDATEWDTFLQKRGPVPVYRVRTELRDKEPMESKAAYDAFWAANEKYLERLVRHVSRNFPCPFPPSVFDYETRLRRKQTWKDAQAIGSSSSLSIDEKIERLSVAGDSMIAVGWESKGFVHVVMGGVYINAGMDSIGYQYLHRGAHEIKPHIPTWTINLYGTMGAHHNKHGRADSAYYYWDRAREMALEYGLYYEYCRITNFYSRHFMFSGRADLAADYLNESLGVYETRDLAALRFPLEAAEFYIGLGCWSHASNIVASLHPDTIYPVERAQLHKIVGHINTLRGDFAAADSAFELRRLDERDPTVTQVPAYYYLWADALIAANKLDKARTVIDEGLDEGAAFSNVTLPLRIRLAQVLIQQGDVAGAGRILSDINDAIDRTYTLPSPHSTPAKLVRTEYAMAAGGVEAARKRLGIETMALARDATGVDAGTLGYLALDRADALRLAWHDLFSGQPVMQLGIELAWQRLAEQLGTAAKGSPTVIADFRSHCLNLANEMTASIGQNCAFVFADNDDAVLRFHVHDNAVSLDTLVVSRLELTRQVKSMWQQMADARLATDLSQAQALALRQLRQVLLTDHCIESDGVLYVRPSGSVSLLPFEALNTDDDTYNPLILERRVAYIRPLSYKDVAAAPLSLIVADPELPDGIARRLAIRQLPQAKVEGCVAAENMIAPMHVTGQQATKRQLLENWGSATAIYIAAHSVRDPERPVIPVMPLAQDVTAIDEDPNLTIFDVRSADFSKCRLVVLSGCSTGAPYLAGQTIGPSFADAFLDAGAHEVIQTLWDVTDESACGLMTRFLTLRDPLSINDADALAEAKREMARRGTHPHFWAGMTIKRRGVN